MLFRSRVKSIFLILLLVAGVYFAFLILYGARSQASEIAHVQINEISRDSRALQYLFRQDDTTKFQPQQNPASGSSLIVNNMQSIVPSQPNNPVAQPFIAQNNIPQPNNVFKPQGPAQIGMQFLSNGIQIQQNPGQGLLDQQNFAQNVPSQNNVHNQLNVTQQNLAPNILQQNNLPGQQNLGQNIPQQNNCFGQQNVGQKVPQQNNLSGQPNLSQNVPPQNNLLVQQTQNIPQQNNILSPQNTAQNMPFQSNATSIQSNPVPIQPVILPYGLHPDVRVLSGYPDPKLILPHRDCVPLPKSPRPGVYICIHPVQDDKWVSGNLKRSQLWEENLLQQMQQALESDPSLMVVDLGCNIGEYTLWAAALGRSVLAIEMLMPNIELVQTSLQLSNLSSKVTIVNNAVYKDHRTLETKFMSQNMGGSRLNTSKFYETPDLSKGKISVKTICIDDLLPLLPSTSVYMKMDIENSEHHALECAHYFFTKANIKILQMEWLNRTPEESKQIEDFMKAQGYIMSASAVQYIPRSLQTDVFFLKKSAFKI